MDKSWIKMQSFKSKCHLCFESQTNQQQKWLSAEKLALEAKKITLSFPIKFEKNDEKNEKTAHKTNTLCFVTH